MKSKTIIRKKIVALILIISSTMVACAQPVNWTAQYDATLPPPNLVDHTTGVKSIAYNPLNNHVYSYGHKYFQLPGSPGQAYIAQLGVVEFNSAGSVINEVFDQHFNSVQLYGFNDIAGRMIISNDGSVYVTGSYYYDDVYGYNIVVIKYNSSLTEQWRHYFRGAGNSSDAGIALTFDPSGNICVTGQIGDSGNSTGQDVRIAKLDPSGNLLWKVNFNSEQSENDTPADITCDNAGNIYVAGYTTSANNGTEAILIKYSNSGVLLWKKKYNQVKNAPGNNRAISVAIDNLSGNVYVTGTTMNASGNSDIETACVSSGGNKIWIRKINNTGNSNDQGFKVLVDCEHNIFAGGLIDRDTSANSNTELIIRKYDSSGNILMTKKFNGGLIACTFGDIAVAPSGSIYITGSGIVSPGSSLDYRDLITAKYNATGSMQWSDIYNAEPAACDNESYGWQIAIDTIISEVAVGGKYAGFCPGFHPDGWLVRVYNPSLRESTAGLTTLGKDNVDYLNVYPNPSSDWIHISYRSNENESYSINIFDVYGKCIKSFIFLSSENDLGIAELSKGVYFLEAITTKGNCVKILSKE